jgi:hypothetical protein
VGSSAEVKAGAAVEVGAEGGVEAKPLEESVVMPASMATARNADVAVEPSASPAVDEHPAAETSPVRTKEDVLNDPIVRRALEVFQGRITGLEVRP